MKNYNITVNGTTYAVGVEEVGEGVSSIPAAPAASAPTPKPSGNVQGAIKIEAQMPGTIVDVKVKVGDNVKNGTVVAILEALKMESDIVAATDGVITSIDVEKGASVSTGQIIATMSA